MAGHVSTQESGVETTEKPGDTKSVEVATNLHSALQQVERQLDQLRQACGDVSRCENLPVEDRAEIIMGVAQSLAYRVADVQWWMTNQAGQVQGEPPERSQPSARECARRYDERAARREQLRERAKRRWDRIEVLYIRVTGGQYPTARRIEEDTRGRVSRGYASALRRGLILNPGQDKLQALAERLGVRLEYLLDPDNEDR